ncbi:MAG: oxygenase MpaB family protein, partial [Bacteroidia bacterium]
MIDPNDPVALEKLRNECDPVADAVITEIMALGDLSQLQSVFDVLRHNNDIKKADFSGLPDEVSKVVWEFFRIGETLPDFVDTEKIKTGESIFQRYGPEISILLLSMALPLCYSCRKGAKVLVMTGRTLDPDKNVDTLSRRLLETAQFVVYCMSPGGMSIGGMGITSSLKVRLIHASIRYFILIKQTNPGGWDLEEYGHPLNQQDKAGTLISFSALTLYGLSRMG